MSGCLIETSISISYLVDAIGAGWHAIETRGNGLGIGFGKLIKGSDRACDASRRFDYDMYLSQALLHMDVSFGFSLCPVGDIEV